MRQKEKKGASRENYWKEEIDGSQRKTSRNKKEAYRSRSNSELREFVQSNAMCGRFKQAGAQRPKLLSAYIPGHSVKVCWRTIMLKTFTTSVNDCYCSILK